MTNLNKKSINDLIKINLGITILTQALTATDTNQLLDEEEWSGIFHVLGFQMDVQRALRGRISDFIPAYELDSEKIKGTE